MLIALATKHEKEKIFEPIFSALGWELRLSEIDTDQFGTFSGEIERKLTPRDTAIAKAKAAANAAGLSRAVASEGSVGPHPQIPFINADLEWVAYVDLDAGLDLVESVVSSDIVAFQTPYQDGLDISEVMKKADLPDHALIAKAESDFGIWAMKGLRSRGDIEKAIAQASELGILSSLVFESDFRAMCSPSRQRNIKACVEKLVRRLESRCPACQSRGFGLVDFERGVACSDCGEISMTAVRAEIHGCLLCSHREVRENGLTTISPALCQACNP